MGTLSIPDVACSAILIEPVASLPNNLCIACSLSSAHHNQVVMQIMNISPSPVTIFQGMTLGRAIPEDNVLFVSDSKKEANATTLWFDDLQLPDLSDPEKTKMAGISISYPLKSPSTEWSWITID